MSRRRPPADPTPLAGPLLCVDPSSTCTGAALLDASGRGIDFALFRPPGSRPLERRVARMVGDLSEWLAWRDPIPAAVVEVTSGMAYKRVRASSLSALAFAQGVVWWTLRDRVGEVVLVDEQQWTRRARKTDRAAATRLLCPEYAAWARTHNDRGLDVADACGLGLWHLGKLPRGIVA